MPNIPKEILNRAVVKKPQLKRSRPRSRQRRTEHSSSKTESGSDSGDGDGDGDSDDDPETFLNMAADKIAGIIFDRWYEERKVTHPKVLF